MLTKANTRSTVHRIAHLDYVGVKQYDEDGEVVGERRFLGLYASTAYTESVMRVPLVAEKVHAVLDRSGVAPDSHTGKDLLGVLESYPRDELIQASVEQLYETAMSVTQLQERRRTKLFIREDDFGRFVSCLVYIPRDRYNTNVRLRMADILKETFGGESVEFSARVSESALSRLQFVVRVPKGKRVRTLDRAEQDALEHRLVEVSRTWSDRLGDALRADARRGGGRPPHGPVRARLPDRLRGDLHGQPGRGRPQPTSTGSATAPAPASRSTARPTRPTTSAGSSCSASTR